MGPGHVAVTNRQTPCRNEPKRTTTTASFQSNADGTQVTAYAWVSQMSTSIASRHRYQ